MFMLNPFPLARLVSVICILVLAILNRVKKNWDQGQEEMGEEMEGEDVSSSEKMHVE
jgi:hypothetical protein